MKRLLLSASMAAMMTGGAGLALAQSAGARDGSPGPDRGASVTAPSVTEVQTLLGAKGYTNVSAVQAGNANGKVKAHAMKNGVPVNLEIDMTTGSVIEVK